MGSRTTILGVGTLAALLVASAALAARSQPGFVPEARAGAPTPLLTSLMHFAVASDDNIGDVMHRDAVLAGAFHVLDRRSIPKALKGEAAFDRRAWSELGMHAVIKHQVVGNTIHFELYDFARGAKPAVVRDYPAADWRTSAHRFMNDVLKFYTGAGGEFGSRIAFVRTRRTPGVWKNVFTMDMDGARVSTTTSNRSFNVLPSLGPGGQVLFTSYGKRNPDLWMSGDEGLVRLSARPGLNLGGTMSPDGRLVALALSKDGNSELYAIGLDGEIQARLTDDPGIDGSPTWSPSGKQIAFVSDRSGTPQLFRVDADGASPERLTDTGEYNQSPDWNPVFEELIAYTSRVDSRLRVLVLDTSIARSRFLVRRGEHETDPSWSQTGRMVAFATPRGIEITSDFALFEPTLVMPGGEQPDWGPSLSSP